MDSKRTHSEDSYLNEFAFLLDFFLGVPETSPNEWDWSLHTQLNINIILFRIKEATEIKASTVHMFILVFLLTFTDYLLNVHFL